MNDAKRLLSRLKQGGQSAKVRRFIRRYFPEFSTDRDFSQEAVRSVVEMVVNSPGSRYEWRPIGDDYNEDAMAFLEANASVLPDKISEWPPFVVMLFYPNACMRLVDRSNGYLSADHAARMLARASCREADYCEWIDSMCRPGEGWHRQMRDITIRTVGGAFRHPRPHEKSWGRDKAFVVVAKGLMGTTEQPALAGWF